MKDTDLRPRPGESPQDALDRVINAVRAEQAQEIENGNLSSLTDAALADDLIDAEALMADDAQTDVAVERIIFAENEIAGRLGLGEFPQGLSPDAAAAIDRFTRMNTTREGFRRVG